ncbi:hypothetical protein PYW07_002282 [Mythimna separata]|uniref:RING-type domain-containing protein n=1 Tax=Mythimna separata TaxID=271217 RepID=A0AAD8DSY1_MYTSE|nr:hypothetical protein PYW07_002282 [Mythimna separata]
MNNLNIDQTIGCVRKIVENIQCAICDKTDGQRLRYACGHTACDDCVIDAVDCQLCLTPPQASSPQPKLDNALTQRVKNTSELLKVCQDLFGTDVFKHKRLSEQLRIEKELFPECIQAPVKYENKRKSSFHSYKNKENRNTSFFPGEEISHSRENITMDSSAKYVQQWLKKTENDFTRKPFRDLNVNSKLDQNIILPKNNYILQSENDENVSHLNTNRKRSHFKTIDKTTPLRRGNTKPITNQHNKSSKKVKKELHVFNTDYIRNKKKTECDNDESGIFMDDDPIVIDDSQETVIDKDKNAWLAVLEANENEEIESTSLVNLDCSDHKTLYNTSKENLMQPEGLQSKTNPNIKVPFYKKSYIIETCTYCNAAPDKVVGQSEKVEITIDNADFTTTIKISKDVDNISNLNTIKSVSVQTDISEIVPNDYTGFTNLKENDGREDVVSQKSDTQSEDLFKEEGESIGSDYKQNNLQNCLVIAESDSDTEMESSGPVPVKVDVHRSCDESEYGVLSEVVNTQDHDTRPRRAPRGLTPTSTDSSEKENYNPNRMKRHVCKKKKYTKK